jgi:hypothetical protein
VHAAPIAAIAAKTVNRIGLLIVFPFIFDRRASFRGGRDRNLEAAPAGHRLHSRMQKRETDSAQRTTQIRPFSATLRPIERGNGFNLQKIFIFLAHIGPSAHEIVSE